MVFIGHFKFLVGDQKTNSDQLFGLGIVLCLRPWAMGRSVRPNVRIISAVPTERRVSKSGAEGFIQSLWRAVEKLLLVEVWV